MQNLDAIVKRLTEEGQRPQVIGGGGTRLVLSARGARVMAAEAGGRLLEAFFLSGDGKGELTGGDRLWFGPEVGWFWPSLAAAREDPIRHADVPTRFDPGDYAANPGEAGGVRLTTRMKLTDARDGRSIELGVDRGVRLLSRPEDLDATIDALAYATDHALVAEGGDAGATASAWSIGAVPHGGTLVCPTVRPLSVADDATSYYDDFGPGQVTASDDAVRFAIGEGPRIKMGLKAEGTTGRMGFFRDLGGGRLSAVLRFFPALPGEAYCDVPRSADAATRTGGDCLQAYSDDLTYGPFGELEHHDPAVTVGGTECQSHSSVTLLLNGPDAAVRSTGNHLLGVPV